MSTTMSASAEGGRLRRPRWRDPRLLVGLMLVLASIAGVVALVASSQRTAAYAVEKCRLRVFPGLNGSTSWAARDRPGRLDRRSTVQRFLTLTDVAETLNISGQAARALVRSGELQAIQVGGRGQWRIEVSWLEDYVERQKEVTRARVREWTEADAQAR